MKSDLGRVQVIRSAECTEWPEEVKRAFENLIESTETLGFNIICAIGLNHQTRQLSVNFSPGSSNNPHLADMCQDMSEMFKLMAQRFRQ